MPTQIGIEPGAPGRCDVFAPYNEEFAAKIQALGGQWNETKYAWSVAATEIGAIYSILREIFGADDGGEDDFAADEDFFETSPLLPAASFAFGTPGTGSGFETKNLRVRF